ncbi:hypothetical protein I8J29_19665 [Paenibacillus sp. MWE-103]|uniref:Uncharacterized protein n=1 Tax=Paenibacillus artemisiicola TaxID=1172618 RepID=A0ABS3WDN2_9BACL|nr:hypothetical protein [Paenibacillus artemisiicola]MBO7746435.1 hypothetical protein [Paenibacillus artemisiicola]
MLARRGRRDAGAARVTLAQRAGAADAMPERLAAAGQNSPQIGRPAPLREVLLRGKQRRIANEDTGYWSDR